LIEVRSPVRGKIPIRNICFFEAIAAEVRLQDHVAGSAAKLGALVNACRAIRSGFQTIQTLHLVAGEANSA